MADDDAKVRWEEEETSQPPQKAGEGAEEMDQHQTSEQLIEQFLAETGGTVSQAGASTDAAGVLSWEEEPLPEGHRSGFVALIGRPNVGKSTLVNALVGKKVTIVSSKPQTTRSRIRGILTAPEYQMIFVDTPGIHERPLRRLNKIMIQEAVDAIPDADVILFVVDVSVKPRREDRMIARLLQEKARHRPVIFALNKMDRLPVERARELIEAYWAILPEHADSIPVSALKGTNVTLLRDHILQFVPEGPRYYPGDQVTDQTERQIAAELIREALFRYTREEVPHSVAVLVEEFTQRKSGTLYVAATIWVERASQKAIVIGKRGERLKQIGVVARGELERFIGGRVYLDLWVKVKPDWRDHAARLRELGY